MTQSPLFAALLFTFAGCSDAPPPEVEKDQPSEPTPRDESQKADARVAIDAAPDATPDTRADARLEAGVRDASRPGRDAGAALDEAGLLDTVVRETIVVAAGDSYDGAGKRFVAGPALGDGSQSEGQKPVFKLEAGATLRNVVLGAPAADGIHCYGDAQLENIVWQDIGEDALTIKESGTVELRGGSAEHGDDKVFQINAPSTFRVFDFRARDAGKFIRQNGGTTFEVDVHIERCDIAAMKEAIFRTDSDLSRVTMVDSRYSEIGKALFLGVDASKVVLRNNTAY